MNDETGPNPSTVQEFEKALNDLIRAADDNNVDVVGGVDIIEPFEKTDSWTVEITRVDRPVLVDQ